MEKPIKTITKEDIGHPFDFKHVYHVGWDSTNKKYVQEVIETTNNPDVELSVPVTASSGPSGVRRKKAAPAPPQNSSQSPDSSLNLNTILTKAGVSQKHLEDEDTRMFIYDFLQKHGGWKVVGSHGYSSNNSKKVTHDFEDPYTIVEKVRVSEKQFQEDHTQNNFEHPIFVLPDSELSVCSTKDDQDTNQNNPTIIKKLSEETEIKTNNFDVVIESLETQKITQDVIVSKESSGPPVSSRTYSEYSCENKNTIQESARKSITPIPSPRTKKNIGHPFDFKHVSHVGLDSIDKKDIKETIETTNNSGVDLSSPVPASSGLSSVPRKKAASAPLQNSSQYPDSSLNTLFIKAGISQKQLEDEDTRNFIYDFLNRHGGWKVVESSNNSKEVTQPFEDPGTFLEKVGVSEQQFQEDDTQKIENNSSVDFSLPVPASSGPSSVCRKEEASAAPQDEYTRKFIYGFPNNHEISKVIGSSNNSERVTQPFEDPHMFDEKIGVSKKQFQDDDAQKIENNVEEPISDFLSLDSEPSLCSTRKYQDTTQDNPRIIEKSNKEIKRKTNNFDVIFESSETQKVTQECISDLQESSKPPVSSTTYSNDENQNTMQGNARKSVTPTPAPRRLIQKTVYKSEEPISNLKIPVPRSRSFNRTVTEQRLDPN